MIITGKVLTSKVNKRTNKDGIEKITTMLNMVNDKYDNIFINVEGETIEFDKKFIKVKVYGEDPFYNVIDNEIEVIEDKEDFKANINNEMENMKLLDILENKTNIKTLVIQNENDKIFKIKIVNSERIKKESLEEKLSNRIFTISYILTSSFDKKTYFRIEDLKNSLKIKKG